MKRAIGAILCCAMLMSAAPLATAQGAPSQTVAIEKVQTDAASGISEYKLKPNGLQVLLAERHHTPIVTVMVVYHVGSRNEAAGYTGATHFLEHMMFRGTKAHDPTKGTGIDDVLKPIGGINNATTFYDRTNYYETVPAEEMGVCLELEADRMRNALLRETDRQQEMTVVRNELERNDDDPGRIVDVNLFAQAYMAHPYHHPVIGWRSDVEGVPIERLRQFYNDFYYPNNATLVVIGDFKSAEALSLITKYFGKVPAAPKAFPKVYTQEAKQQGEKRFVVQRGQDLPKVIFGYHIPKAVDKDTYPLEVAASLLGDDKKQSSRLYKALVDKGLASDCYAYNYSLRDPGMFTVVATATPDTTPAKVEETIATELKRLADEPITDDELDKAKKSVWKRMKLDASDPMGTASQLAEAIAVADWQWWVNLEKNIKAVTKEDVRAAITRHVINSNKTVGYYIPTKKPDAVKEAGKKEPDKKDVEKKDVEKKDVAEPKSSTPPNPTEIKAKLLDIPASFVVAQNIEQKPGTSSTAAPSPSKTSTTQRASIAAQVQKRVLPNGLTVLVMPAKGTGVVAVSGKVMAGSYFDPKGQNMTAEFAADMLDKGSAKWSKEEIARQLELMGASLQFSAANFWMSFASEVVREDVPTLLSIIGDVIQNPQFAPEELDKLRKQEVAAIQAAMAETGQVAANAFYNTAYKDGCVYHEDTFNEQLKQLPEIKPELLKQFHATNVTPGNTVISVVGDIDAEEAFDLITKNFSNWSGNKRNSVELADCTAGGIEGKRITNPIPDKTNIDVVMGFPANVSIKSSDFYAASLANSALGHDTISSRLAEIRNKHGYTYGISSYFAENAFPGGPWVVQFSVNPENLNKALPEVDKIINEFVKTGIKPDELKSEDSRLAGEYIVERMRTPSNIADALTKYEMLGLGAKFMDEYPQRLKSVTVPEANDAIKKYFNTKDLLMSVAGTLPAK